MTEPRTSARYDCIVIGAGHHGLICAATLARGGRSVLVVEAQSQVGGAALTRELAPGFKVSACALTVSRGGVGADNEAYLAYDEQMQRFARALVALFSRFRRVWERRHGRTFPHSRA